MEGVACERINWLHDHDYVYHGCYRIASGNRSRKAFKREQNLITPLGWLAVAACLVGLFGAVLSGVGV